MKRWPIVRHVRYLWLSWCFWRWWKHIGSHIAAVPNQSDFEYLADVWNGRA